MSMRVVRGVRDRIQRVVGGVVAGVVVSAAGQIAITAAASQQVLVTGPGGIVFANSTTFNGTANTFAGTGTHTFSGPVRVNLNTGTGFQSDFSSASSQVVLLGSRSGSGRQRVVLNATNDLRFDVSTDGSTWTESLQIRNDNARVVVQTNLGVQVANPGVAVDVAGTVRSTATSGTAVVGIANAAGIQAGHFQQSAASATAPVMVVRLGATPGAGGDAQVWQDSVPNTLVRINSSGTLTLFGSGGTAGGVLDMLGRGSAPSAASSGRALWWYDDTDKRFSFIDSAAAVRHLDPASIARGGGSVVVSAAGAISLTTASAQNLSLSAPSGIIIANQQITCVNILSSGTLTVTGTSTHTFSGPVMVRRSGSFANMLIADMDHASDVGIMSSLRRQNAVRGRWALQASNDVTFETLTGSAGSETAIEALRFLNASGRVTIPTRLRIGDSSDPAHPLEVAGNVHMTTGGMGLGINPSASYRLVSRGNGVTHSAALFEQNAASATVPVLVVKLGATPDTGGDALQVQSSGGTVNMRIAAVGNVVLRNDRAVQINEATNTTPITILHVDNTDMLQIGNTSLVTNLRGSNWGYTTDGAATVAGYITAKINGIDRKLMIAA